MLKELRESVGWLKFIAEAELLSGRKLGELVDEGEQLKKIFAKSLVTTKSRPERGVKL